MGNELSHKGRSVVAIGMFDGVHRGHLEVLDLVRNIASSRGLTSGVVTFSRHPAQVLRHSCDFRFLTSVENRVALIKNNGIDKVFLLDFTPSLASLDSMEFMRYMAREFGVEVLVMGYNHRFGHNRDAQFSDYVTQGAELGIGVVRASEYVGEYSPVSSSLIRSAISESHVRAAANMLGRCHYTTGIVVEGFQNGRKLGFPTANVEPVDDSVIVPPRGVYAVRIHVDGCGSHNGVCNIGLRPTVSENGKESIEVHIFNFNADIYGLKVKVEYVDFIRSEQRFSSIDELKAQISHDKQRALCILENNETR